MNNVNLSKIYYKKARLDIIYWIVTILSIVVTVLCYVKSKDLNSAISLVFIIPFVYTIMLVLSTTNRKIINNLGVAIINIVMFIRCIIYPFLLCTFSSQVNILNSSYSQTSIMLIAFETFGVFIVLNIWGKRLLKNENDGISTGSYYAKVNLAILAALFLFVLAVVLYPSLLTKYFIFSGSYIATQGISGVLSVFFDIGIDIIYILVIFYIFKMSNSGRYFIMLIISLVLSLVIILGDAHFVGNISRWGFLISSIATLLLLTKLYKKYTKSVLTIGIPAIIISIMFFTFVKFGDAFSLEMFFQRYLSARSLDYYFMGIENVNYGLAVKGTFSSQIGLSTMLTDMFSAVPILSTLFDATTNSTPVFYHMLMGRDDTIIPTVAQSYTYFGFLGAPIFSMFLTGLTIEVNRKIKNCDNLFMYYVLAQLTVWFALFMAININIIQEGTWKRLIFILIIYLNSKFVLKKKENRNDPNKRYCTGI